MAVLKRGKQVRFKLGTGNRFKALTSKLGQNPKIKNPAAVAAAIGRKKYGSKKMNSMARKGKKNLMLHQRIARGMPVR